MRTKRAVHRSSNEANFRTAAYEAISAYVNVATPDVIPVIQNTVVTTSKRAERLLQNHNQIVVSMTATTGTSYRATIATSSR